MSLLIHRVKNKTDYRALAGSTRTVIMTLKLFAIDELIEDKLSDANLSDDDEVGPPFLKDAMDCIQKLLSSKE
ncbi:hypothetical protein AVEN_206921-1 [Araneus ventricosus]|uniref:Uncharacterized protein n=1 Tax=Araneus ventricosus TaxID=182803 RepID=A0A4Y2RGC9_ARAVE|nr:hypothetical protein AVEN_206921-1 [Araneus ventricosus]